MRLLTKAETCRELGLSRSALERGSPPGGCRPKESPEYGGADSPRAWDGAARFG